MLLCESVIVVIFDTANMNVSECGMVIGYTTV